jgi:glc operon protein GlcG
MRMKPALEAADAAAILAAAKAEAQKQGWKVTIAIVDEGGALLALERLDGAPLKSPDIATEKARTAALFRRPSKAFQDLIKSRPEMLRLPAFPVQGGVPVMAGAECVGGVGVSGVQSHEDEQVALAGAAAVKG